MPRCRLQNSYKIEVFMREYTLLTLTIAIVYFVAHTACEVQMDGFAYKPKLVAAAHQLKQRAGGCGAMVGFLVSFLY